MFDPERLLGQMLGQGLGFGHGYKDKKKYRHGHGSEGLVNKAQLGVGLLGVAIAAWEHYSQQKSAGAASAGAQSLPPLPAAQGSTPAAYATAALPPAHAVPPPPPPPAATSSVARVPATAAALPHPSHSDALHLLRTMIAAAQADGEIDAGERRAILERARDSGADPDDLSWLDGELAQRHSVESIIDATRGGLRESTYAAAFAALEIDNEAERRWLQQLSVGLRLSDAERDAIERAVAESRRG